MPRQKNAEGSKQSRTQIPMTREQATMRARAYFESVDYAFSVYTGVHTKPITIMYSSAYKDTFGMDPSEYIDENDDYTYYRGQITVRTRLEYIWKMQRQLLEEVECSLPINFIKADRIQPVIVPPRRMRDYDEPHQESPLKIASENIRRSILAATEQYNDAVSQAKDKLPQMFLDGEGSDLDCDDFMDGWSVYREELNQFQKLAFQFLYLLTQMCNLLFCKRNGVSIRRVGPLKFDKHVRVLIQKRRILLQKTNDSRFRYGRF